MHKKTNKTRTFPNFRKMREFAVSIEHSEAKSVSASGGVPDQGLCPWIPLGAPPPYPRYRLALHALAMAPPLLNSKYATAGIGQ